MVIFTTLARAVFKLCPVIFGRTFPNFTIYSNFFHRILISRFFHCFQNFPGIEKFSKVGKIFQFAPPRSLKGATKRATKIPVGSCAAGSCKFSRSKQLQFSKELYTLSAPKGAGPAATLCRELQLEKFSISYKIFQLHLDQRRKKIKF